MSTARPPSSSVAPYRSVTRSRAGRRKRTERPKSPWSAWVANRQYWTVHGRSSPRCARTSSISAFDASAGIMIWIGSPESRTSAKTTTDTTNIDTIDWITRPMMKRCIRASALEELDRFRQSDQEDAPALGRGRVLAIGGRVEIVAGLQAHERGGPAALLVVAEDLDGGAPCRQGAPRDVLAPKRRGGTGRLGHGQLRPQSRFVAIRAPSTNAS